MDNYRMKQAPKIKQALKFMGDTILLKHRKQSKIPKTVRVISLSGIFLMIFFTVLYIYYLRTGEAQKYLESIRNFGSLGIALGILIQMLVNIFPVPGEFVSVFLMEVYGVFWGSILSWISGIGGAISALYITRWIARPMAEQIAGPHLQKMNTWLKHHETFGMLLIRFVPLVPYHLVNYAAGLLRVKLITFIWTTALGILPYTIAMGGIFAGFRHGHLVWGLIGGFMFVLLSILGWLYRKKGFGVQNN